MMATPTRTTPSNSTIDADKLYLLTQVLQQPDDDSKPMKQIFFSHQVDSIEALFDYDFDDYETLTWTDKDDDGNDVIKPIPKGCARLLQALKRYLHYLHRMGSPVDPHDWQGSIIAEDFLTFWFSPYNVPNAPPVTPAHSPFPSGTGGRSLSKTLAF